MATSFAASAKRMASFWESLRWGGEVPGEPCVNGSAGASPSQKISLASVRAGPVRLNLPTDWAPFASGKFGTPSGKCEFYSETQKSLGQDPLPLYRFTLSGRTFFDCRLY